WIHPPESEIGPLWDSPAARWPYIIRERSTEAPAAVSLSIPHDQPAPAAPASGQAALVGGQPLVANRQPLGGSSRLFAPPAVPTPAISSSPAAAFPSGASSVWKRPEPMQQSTMGHDGMVEEDSSPPRAEASWANQHAKRDEKGKSGRSEVEVQTEPARKIPLGYGQPSAAFHMHPPPLPLHKPRKRSKSPHTTVILASSAEQAAQFTKQLDKMGALKRMSNGEAKIIGPHPSTIRVAARYASQAAVESALHPTTVLDLQERSLAEAREDSVRLQGVTWLDTTRRALQLPIRTFTTACSYFHYFRLAHPGAMDYAWSDAAAAALLVSCKAEDTLKKSRDILAAAYNVKAGSHDALSADDVVSEAPSRIVIGLERLMLESSSFDFRSKYPHKLLVKVCKNLPESEEKKAVSIVAWSVVTDLHRTFAHLKQSTATVALASLELAAHLQASASGNGTSLVKEQLQEMDVGKWSSSREEVMETLLDLLDLYTHHTSSTIVGTKYSLDDFLRIRLALNKECNDNGIP
ncbi:RNA polymerase II C-terminal domain kinase beta subunit, partial [Friedmanniomyces endolithicus]